MVEQLDSEFHKKHERLTNEILNNPEMLPSRYVFVITNLCNLNCNFCFQNRNPRKDAMTSENWINLANQLPEYSRVTLTGGEPFIFPEFRKVFSHIAEKFDCNIITNGILLNKELIDYLLSFPKFKVLSLSIDNIGNTTRGVKQEQWENLVKNLNYFIEKRNQSNHPCLLDIKTMVLDETADNLFEIYKEIINQINPDTYAFQFLKGSPIQHADVMYEFEDLSKKSKAQTYQRFDKIKQQLKEIKNYNLQTNKKSFIHPKFADLNSEDELNHLDSNLNILNKEEPNNLDILNNSEHLKENFQPCKFAHSSVHINVDGNIFPCLAVSMGNVKHQSLKEIIQGEKMKKFRQLITTQETLEACNRCGWLRLKN